MQDYEKEIGCLFRQNNRSTLVLVVDIRNAILNEVNYNYIVFEYCDGERYSLDTEGFYKQFAKVS
jgi:hypothetical protein